MKSRIAFSYFLLLMNNPLSLYVSPMGIVEELFETPYEDEAIAFPSHAVNLGPNAWL